MDRSRFADRREAGEQLTVALQAWSGCGANSSVIALPRGGVVVGAAVAQGLSLPLRTWAVRKLADPREPEVAIGAIAPGGVALWNESAGGMEQLTPHVREQLLAAQEQELRRRRRLYGDPAAEELRGRHLIVVDDGIATGWTARAALLSLRQLNPASLVLAAPVCERTLKPELETLVEQLVVLRWVHRLQAVGQWYGHFEPVEDEQVLALLAGRV